MSATGPVTGVWLAGAASEFWVERVRVSALLVRFVTPTVMSEPVRPKARPSAEGSSYSTGAVKSPTVAASNQ